MADRFVLFDHPAGGDSFQSWRAYLRDLLGFPASQISSVSDYALPPLLGAFRDCGQSQCLAIICGAIDENRLPRSKVGDFAREQGAEFVAIGTPSRYQLLQVGPYSITHSVTDRLPSWSPGFRRDRLIAKSHVLMPFRSEDHLRKAFAACHDAIYMETARDPAATFDLLSLIIAAKVMDEQSESTHYEFSELIGEDGPAAVGRLSTLLRQARRWLAGQDLDESEIREAPSLRPAVVSTVFRELQDFSLTLTSDAPSGTDLLGVAYEQLVGATFRGELGSYFTPRNIADFMVRLLGAQRGRIFDPSCGSGGLLIAAHRYSVAEAPEGERPELFGNDLNPRMVEAAKINFLVHRFDPSRVLRGDGLDLPRMLNRWFGIHREENGKPFWDGHNGPFDFVLANPPFAGHEKNPEILQHFATAYRSDGSLRSLNKTLPFLELIVASLREGGRAGIVLPTSILNAEEESFIRFRELLLAHAELIAIIGLPEKAFVHTDCGVHGALLFFERRSKPRPDYKVFVGWVDNLGYDRLGKPTLTSDFPEILRSYQLGDESVGKNIPVRELVQHQRWDPTWLRLAHSLPSGDPGEFVRLSELVEVRRAKWSRAQLRDGEEYRYFEVVDTDIRTGRIMKIHCVSGFELAKKGRIRNLVRAGDILLPNHRDSLMAASASNGRSVVVVGEEADGVLTTDRFMVLRPRIDPTLLVALLNSRGVRRQLVAHSRGAASLDIREAALAKVLVPRKLLDPERCSGVQSLVEEIGDLRERLERVKGQLSALIEQGFGEDMPIRPPAAR